MSGLLTIDPVFPLWAIAIALIPAFIFFIWKELKSNQRFVGARIIAQLIVLFSIAGIVLRPSQQKEVRTSGILLLTEGYDNFTTDSLIKKYPTLKIVKTPGAEPFDNAEVMLEGQTIPTESDQIRFIAGEGLSPDLLALLPRKNFKFLSGKIPSGVTELFYSNPIIVNHSTIISGIINYTGTATTLKLTGSGIEDSINLKGSGLTPFSFTIKPKQAGQFVYSLQTKDTSVVNEQLPIEVLHEKKLTILFLQKFPTAETRYLKNFLAEQGHRIALRYQTSKSNFSYEYANMPSMSVGRLTPDLTQSIDLLFVDSSVLTELLPGEMTTLIDGIHNGLGMIILDLPEKEKTISRFLSLTFKPTKIDTLHIRLGSQAQYTLPIQPIDISSSRYIVPTMTHNNRIISGYGFKGAGRIGFTITRETYRVRLQGNTDDYAFIWSDLIEKTSRVKSNDFKVRIKNPFPFYPDQSLGVEVISANGSPTLLAGSTRLPIEEDVIIDDLWHAKTWAPNPGWHRLSIKEDSSRLNYFVSGKSDWNALRVVNNRSATKLAESDQEIKSIEHISSETREIPPLIFFLLFLFAAGFLWLAPKI
ncbi:hypothetical protein BH09BAC3_BH09BAC3_15070 [soil metagenome]